MQTKLSSIYVASCSSVGSQSREKINVLLARQDSELLSHLERGVGRERLKWHCESSAQGCTAVWRAVLQDVHGSTCPETLINFHSALAKTSVTALGANVGHLGKSRENEFRSTEMTCTKD